MVKNKTKLTGKAAEQLEKCDNTLQLQAVTVDIDTVFGRQKL